MRDRLYCNDCCRFITENDIQETSEDRIIHKGHELVWIKTPDGCDGLTNDELNVKFVEEAQK